MVLTNRRVKTHLVIKNATLQVGSLFFLLNFSKARGLRVRGDRRSREKKGTKPQQKKKRFHLTFSSPGLVPKDAYCPMLVR